MGFGKFLKRATTIPSKGPLSGLRKVFGENMLDEFGTVAGFALGGPAGAAAGRALGNGVHTQNLGKTLRAGAEGYAMGAGAGALGLSGGGGAIGFGGGAASAAAPVASAAPSMAAAPAAGFAAPTANIASSANQALSLGKAGRFLGQAGKWAGDNTDLIGLGLQGVGLYQGAQAAGREAEMDDRRLAMEEEDRKRLLSERDQNGRASDAFLSSLIAAPLYKRGSMNVPYQFNG